MSESKACSKCKQVKPLADFHKSKAAKSGHKPSCKQCKYLANKVYRTENPEKIREIKKAWCLKNPEKLAEYRKRAGSYPVVYDPNKARLYHEKNKDKLNARCRQWRAKNHAKARELEKSYRLANPQVGRLQNQRRRALKAQSGVYRITTKDCAKILSNPCFYCGSQASHLDHVVPLALGGRHSLGNLVASCVKCNTSKNKKTIMQWRVWQARVLRSNHN
jgi:5-methylcytosine-specific restriction endonuclease McrA